MANQQRSDIIMLSLRKADTEMDAVTDKAVAAYQLVVSILTQLSHLLTLNFKMATVAGVEDFCSRMCCEMEAVRPLTMPNIHFMVIHR